MCAGRAGAIEGAFFNEKNRSGSAHENKEVEMEEGENAGSGVVDEKCVGSVPGGMKAVEIVNTNTKRG